jgi:hypothetical protein
VFREVELFSGVKTVLRVKDTVVVDQAIEAVSVSIDPAKRARANASGDMDVNDIQP